MCIMNTEQRSKNIFTYIVLSSLILCIRDADLAYEKRR